MSGVEIVGLVAAAAQFADLGAKVLLGLSSLISSLRDVPSRIESAATALKIFVDLSHALRAHLETLPPPAISEATQTQIKDLFDACGSETCAITNILEEITTKTSDNKLAKTWKRLVGVKREKDILERFERLERHKSSLVLLLEDQVVFFGIQQQ
jgi:hypothetical protein